MYLDSNLRFEVISSFLGHELQPYDKHRCGRTEQVLSVDDFHLHNLIGPQRAFFSSINEKEFFDPQFDHDFTDLSDLAVCMRGDELYKRPKGWYRIALKVKGKYPDGDTWLGPNGWRSHSAPGEWPVSYHGTSLDGAKGIIRSYYKAGDRAAYGRGIYSTPNLHEADISYAQTFTSKTTGKSYKVILQNRINPRKRQICERREYWLIPVPEGTSDEEEKKIVESSIRPYGILIKELNDDDDDDDNDDDDNGDDDDDDDDGDNGDDDGDDDNGDDDDHDDDGDNGDDDDESHNNDDNSNNDTDSFCILF